MLKDIVAVQPLEEYKLLLRFEDGVKGVVDVSQLVEFSGVFAPFKDLSFFNQVQLNPELGTIVWPNEADLDPDVLYAIVTGQPIPDYKERAFQ
jgi:Protein of unknown function (DUF2442)